MRSLVLASLLLASFTPLALADCVSNVCTDQAQSGSGDCANPGDSGFAATLVEVFTPAGLVVVGGQTSCYNDFENGRFVGNVVFASTPDGSVYWSGSPTSCVLYGDVDGASFFEPCGPAGPPNPGWGHLLP